MKALVLSALLLLFALGYSSFARAEEGVVASPVDLYISGFGGFAHPFNADISFTRLTLYDVKLDDSPSFGGKIGMWFTAPRRSLGVDVGVEIDGTILFNPDVSSGQILSSSVGIGILLSRLDLDAKYVGLNLLARLPIGVTTDLPNGRWFPYIGLGGGAQHLLLQALGREGTDTAPAFQGLGGVKVFLTKHVAVFAEGKFIHAAHSISIVGVSNVDLTVSGLHGVGGLSLHF